MRTRLVALDEGKLFRVLPEDTPCKLPSGGLVELREAENEVKIFHRGSWRSCVVFDDREIGPIMADKVSSHVTLALSSLREGAIPSAIDSLEQVLKILRGDHGER